MKILLIIVLTIATLTTCATKEERSSVELRGRVLDAETGEPLKYANVVIVGSQKGAMSDSTGYFTIRALPVGTHTVKAMRMGYPSSTSEVVLKAGTGNWHDFRLNRYGISRATASAESIGVDADVSSDDIECEIIPAKNEFRVGDTPAFDVILRNKSAKFFYLVYCTDSSNRRKRYPHVELNIEGPDNGVVVPGFDYCGTAGMLQHRDFFRVEPGSEFRPYELGYWPVWVTHGRFEEPGTYVVTFKYSTDEGDIRQWLGYRTRVDSSISNWIRSVPRVELVDSIVLQVVE